MIPRFRPPTFAEGSEITKLAVEHPVFQAAAQAVFERAKQIASDEGATEFAAALRLVTQQRPGGRWEMEIIADTKAGEAVEFGDTNTTRRRILGRAGGVST